MRLFMAAARWLSSMLVAVSDRAATSWSSTPSSSWKPLAPRGDSALAAPQDNDKMGQAQEVDKSVSCEDEVAR